MLLSIIFHHIIAIFKDMYVCMYVCMYLFIYYIFIYLFISYLSLEPGLVIAKKVISLHGGVVFFETEIGKREIDYNTYINLYTFTHLYIFLKWEYCFYWSLYIFIYLFIHLCIYLFTSYLFKNINEYNTSI